MDTEKKKDCSETDKKSQYYDARTKKTEAVPKQIIPTLFRNNMNKNPDYPILYEKTDPIIVNFDKIYTFKQYYDEIMMFAKSIIKLKVEPLKSICIMGFNSPQWFISELGAIFAGTVACGIYTTNNAEACQFIMQDCSCQLLILENNSYLNRLKPILSSFTDLRAVVLYRDQVTNENCELGDNKIPVYNWSEFIQLGVDTITDTMVDERINNINPDDCCVLIYTSGTTGNPKGVMITHDNAIYTTQMTFLHLETNNFEHRIVSYLPLNHVAANLLDIISSFVWGFSIYFAQKDALRGTLVQTLKEVKPTLFLGVPRVFEKMHDKMLEIESNMSGLKLKFANWAKSVGYYNSQMKMSGKATDYSYYIANILFYKVKQAMGLDQASFIFSGAAPITEEIVKFFLHYDIQIAQIYGMSECTGPHTVGISKRMSLGAAGECLLGVEMKIENCGGDSDEKDVGEICMRGRHVFPGYWNNEEKTKETLDADGWLHSGDLGRIDEKGQLFIVGRIKELIVTAGGENVAPVPIEDKLKAELPFISNVMLVGDKLKFISCLITLKTIIDPNTQEPTNELLPLASKKLEELCGLDENSLLNMDQVLELIKQPNNPLSKLIDEAITRVNQKSISNAARVQKWTILKNDFSMNNGELGPTMKLKRFFVMKKYEQEIQAMYA